jgi:hypothetical protein
VATGDEMSIYRMTRLLRYGATGDYATELDRSLQAYADISQTDPTFAPEKLAAADAWAKQEYIQYFANSPLLGAQPTVCGN